MRNSSSTIMPRSRSSGLRFSSDSFAWIFRTNLPPRRGMPLPTVHSRNLFGLGEIIQVLASPGETLKSLAEARKSLEEARQEIKESKERSQLPTTHTFSPLPGFFERPAEIRTLTRIFEGPPSFTVLCGASSVGKTALLREVLSSSRYHVLHFDLRIAGFADLAGLYLSMNKQMEQYFNILSQTEEGYQEFEKEAWAFKHDRLNIERSIERGGSEIVKTSDVARLMELFQSALLHYWKFDPQKENGNDDAISSEGTRVEVTHQKQHSRDTERTAEKSPEPDACAPIGSEYTRRRMPVIFFDEAHKLPALIRSKEAMKCLLDSMLVLTKQDRLCHVVHATSDSFYQSWLRQLNIMQHCKIICIGDCSKAETQAYFEERLLPGVPESLRPNLDFEAIYDAFGGKLVHWADYVTDFINAGGDFSIERSSHFLQAHSLLNLQLLHASESELDALEKEKHGSRRSTAHFPTPPPAGFKIYTPLPSVGAPLNRFSTASTAPPSFKAMQLLDVMHKVSATGAGPGCIRYFALCRAIGVRAVDDMVRARVFELRWSEPVTVEGGGYDKVLKLERYEEDAPGPVVRPTTPIIAYAMRSVLREYEYEPAQEEEEEEEEGEEGDTAVGTGTDERIEKRMREREREEYDYRESSGMSDDKSDYMSLPDVDEY